MLEISIRNGESEEDAEEENNELSLELSIGGNYEKLKKEMDDDDNNNNNNVDAKVVPRSGLTFPETVTETESGTGLDLERKREIQALRRQEARKKREDKLIRKSVSVTNNNTSSSSSTADATNTNTASSFIINNGGEDRMLLSLEKQQFQSRARDRENRENDQEGCLPHKNGVSLLLTGNGSGSHRNIDYVAGVGLGPKVLDVPAVYFRSQKNNNNVPRHCFASTGKNGLGHEEGNVLDIKGKEEEKKKKKRNVFNIAQPIPVSVAVPPAAGMNYCGSFRPYPPIVNGNLKLKSEDNDSCNYISGNGKVGFYDSERNGGGSEIPKLMSVNGSPERTSSAVSDHRSTSAGKGGRSSSESGSHSSSSNNNNNNNNNNNGGNEELQIGGRKMKITQPSEETIALNCRPQKDDDDLGEMGKKRIRSCEKKEKEEAGGDGDGKTDKVLPPSPCFPFVSTTGKGPNGKTIKGILQKYTKTTEVRIVCVCHGNSLSPAEFVEHAGGEGTHITNPLRQITMLPSSSLN